MNEISIVEIFLEELNNYKYHLLASAVLPYASYYFYRTSKTVTKNISKEISKRKKEKKKITKFISHEKENLGIEIDGQDISVYEERIKDLVQRLNSTHSKFTIKAAEAFMIVDLFADSVKINNDGELIIDVNSAKLFSQTIFNDPMKFITYIKSIEKKIDLAASKEKIPLEDVLYMMRNAKKFALDSTDNETELAYKIKKAVHDNYYKDVTVYLS